MIIKTTLVAANEQKGVRIRARCRDEGGHVHTITVPFELGDVNPHTRAAKALAKLVTGQEEVRRLDPAERGARFTFSTKTARLTGRGTTMQDVADLANVSERTVSNAINNPERLNPRTLQRVRATIEQLGYVRHENMVRKNGRVTK